MRLDDPQHPFLVGSAGQAEPHQHPVPMLPDQVEVLDDGSVLGQDPHRPAGLGQDRFEASPPEVKFLGFRRPSIHSGAKLDETSAAQPFGIRGHLVDDVGVDDGVAGGERLLAEFLERLVASEHRPAGAIGAVVATPEPTFTAYWASPFLANSGDGRMPPPVNE